MLHFITDCPLDWARNTVAGAGFAEPATDSAWAKSVVHVADRYASGVISAIADMGFVVQGRRPAKQAISDPTFAMAAASIERNGGSSAPAAAFAR